MTRPHPSPDVHDKYQASTALKELWPNLHPSEKKQITAFLQAELSARPIVVNDDRRLFITDCRNLSTGRKFWTIALGYQYRAPQAIGQDMQWWCDLTGIKTNRPSKEYIPYASPQRLSEEGEKLLKEILETLGPAKSITGGDPKDTALKVVGLFEARSKTPPSYRIADPPLDSSPERSAKPERIAKFANLTKLSKRGGVTKPTPQVQKSTEKKYVQETTETPVILREFVKTLPFKDRLEFKNAIYQSGVLYSSFSPGRPMVYLVKKKPTLDRNGIPF